MRQVELHVEKMIHFEGAPAMRRLLGSGERLALHCASDDVFHSFGDRRCACARFSRPAQAAMHLCFTSASVI